MTKVELNLLGKEDAFQLIGKEWMLVTSGNAQSFNTMTASWGGLGWLWNKPVAFIFIRPERYTYQFIESNERVSLSFFGEECRQALSLCGSKSGRDMNKVKAAGLTPVQLESGNMGYEEARLTLDCRKLFRAEMQEAHFLDKEVLNRWYNDQPGGSLHMIYVLEIESLFTR